MTRAWGEHRCPPARGAAARTRNRRLAAILLAVTLVLVLEPAERAQAVTTTVYDQPFHNNTANGTGTLSKPTGTGVTNVVCLTASGNAATGNLLSCPTNTDAQGSGKLRLTDTGFGEVGAVFGATGIATAGKAIDVTFNAYQYDGTGTLRGNGMSLIFAATDPASPAAPTTVPGNPATIAYTARRPGSVAGVANGYMGIGLDVYGDYSNSDSEGTNCTDPGYISTVGGLVKGQVVVRGPGAGTTGYCAINSTAANTSASALALRAATRSAVPVEVVLNPTTGTIVTPSGLSVAAGQYRIQFTPVGGTTTPLTGALPTVPAGLYTSDTWLAAGIPKNLIVGLAATSGGATDFKEVDAFKVVTLDPAVLTVTQTSYTGASPALGDPVTYTVTAGVATGINEPGPVTVVETVPTGVKPLVAYGSGWVCSAPSGQTVSCTNSNGPFTNGTTLTPIQVVADVTGGSVTPTLIQSSSTATASASDATQGVSSSTTAGTVPSAPSGVTLSRVNGPSAGGSGFYQAESASVSGSALPANDHLNYTGTGFIATGNTVGATDTFTVTVGQAGTYVAGMRYANGAFPAVETKTMSLYVNGTKLRQISLPATADWDTWAMSNESVTLNAGSNTISYTVDTGDIGWLNLDALTTDGVTVSGTNIIAATAIEVGTTAEFQAGTPTTLLPCSAGSAARCFTPNGNGTLIISSMPADTAGVDQVKIVTQGVAGAATYTYFDTLALTFSTPPNGQVAAVYSSTLTATGGLSPLTWSISAGSLPPGITLGSSTGTLSGTPTLTGVYSFTVMVADAGTQTATQATTLTVTAGALSITVPASTVNLGTASAGALTKSGQLGTVTVTDNRGGSTASWITTVSSTTFTTGAGGAGQVIATAQIAYSSGSATSTTGTGTFVPGSLANGSVPGTAAAWTTGAGTNSASWNPTLTLTFLQSQVAGVYSGTITHSVA